MKKLSFARNGYLLISVVFYVVGCLYILIPSIPPEVQTIGVGGLLLIYGMIKIVGFWSDDLYCLAFQYDLACGVLMLLLGICTILFHARVVRYLPVGLGWMVLLDSLLKVQMSRDARAFGLEHWKVLLGISLSVAALSAVLIFCSAGHTVPHLLPGVVLIAQGVLNRSVVRCTVKHPQERRKIKQRQ